MYLNSSMIFDIYLQQTTSVSKIDVNYDLRLCEFGVCCFNILDLSVYDRSAGSSLIVYTKLERNNPKDRHTDVDGQTDRQTDKRTDGRASGFLGGQAGGRATGQIDR